MLPRKRIRQDHGQDLVETALVLPLLLLLLLSIVQLGIVFFQYNSISNAAREGARYAIIHPGQVDSSASTCDDLSNPIRQAACRLTSGLPPGLVTVSFRIIGNAVCVDVTSEVQLLFAPIVIAFGSGGKVSLSASATMQLE